MFEIQHDLFDLGGELSIPGSTLLASGAVPRLEQLIDHYNEALPPLKEFILPGGNRASAVCQLARAVCRRAERAIVSAAESGEVSEAIQQYINRLSDLLFVLSRTLARVDGNQAPRLACGVELIVGGDATEACISAASILAKVERDRLMRALHSLHPEYGFDRHKGYGTALHLESLKRHGPCSEHRRSFAPVREVLSA
jgi:ribonuclease HII